MTIPIDFNFKNAVRQLRIREAGGLKEVFDPVRRRFVRLSPEELTRQVIIHYLMTEKQIPRTRIAVEKAFDLFGLKKRFDLLIFDKEARPLLIVEVKSFQVSIDQTTLDQAGWYNQQIQAPYLLISNGIQSFAFAVDFERGSHKPIDALPW